MLRKGVEERLRGGEPRPALDWLKTRYVLESPQAAHVVRYIAQQMAISAVPSCAKRFAW